MTLNWTGSGDGTSFQDGDNWDAGGLTPVFGDLAIIGAGAAVVVTGTSVESDITLDGSLTFTSGESQNTGTITINSGGLLWFDGAGASGTIIVNSGGICTFVSGSLAGTMTVNSGGVCTFEYGGSSGTVNVNSGGVCTFGISVNSGSVNVNSGGVCTFTQATHGDAGSGSVIISSGGVCNFDNASVIASSLLVNSGGFCYVKNASFFLGGYKTGGGVVSFDKPSFLSTLVGSSSISHNPALLRYPTNFGAGTL